MDAGRGAAGPCTAWPIGGGITPWLERQLHHLNAGAGAVAGLIELDPEEGTALPGAGNATPPTA